MKRKVISLMLVVALVVSLGASAFATNVTTTAPTAPSTANLDAVTRKATFGTYEGFYAEEDLYPGAEVHNVYVDVPAAYDGAFKSDLNANTTDKIKIALTYVLPADAENKAIEGENYPALIQCVRYDLSPSNATGRYKAGTDAYYIERGYVIIRIDLRGMGASGGIAKGFGTRENGLDVAYIMENWLPTQDWYSGKCAMYGSSNQGVIGNTTAVNAPEGMEGYQVGVASVDYYSQKYNNGVSISNNNAGIVPAYSVDTFPNEVLDDASAENPRKIFGEIKPYEEWIKAPTAQFVDDDPEGRIAYEHYVTQQTYNEMFFSYMTVPNMYRDSTDNDGWVVYEDIVLFEEIDQIVDGGLATYNYAGYADIASTAQLALATLTDGNIVISNGNHGGAMRGGDFPNFDSNADFVRYFDWLLKGVDNGFDETPFAYYYLLDTAANPNGTVLEGGNPAHYADSIPYESTVKKDFYFDTKVLIDETSPYWLDGASKNGSLSTTAPEAAGSVDYRVDTSIAFDITGMSNGPIGADSVGFGGTKISGDLSQTVDSKSITFTTEPLTEKITYIGNGTMDIWASCANSNDFDLIGVLEVVRADGTSNYLSRGTLRASHRDASTGEQNNLWDAIGISDYMHDSTKEKVEARMAEGIAEPTLLKFNLELNAVTLNEGDCLRVTLFGVTKRTNAAPQSYMYYKDDGNGGKVLKTGDELPLITFYTGGETASKMTLPTYTTVYNTLNGTVEFDDGSYNGPATMYLLEDYYYLQYNGDWIQLDKETNEINYTVDPNGIANFYNVNFTFRPEGEIIADGLAQLYTGGAEGYYAFPSTFEGCEGTIVELRQGDYIGNQEANGMLTWKGLQYAKAPLFEAPQKLADKAPNAEPIKAQAPGKGTSGLNSANIDCLDLQVFVNPNWDVEKDGPRSVFMWVFGSANMGGSANSNWANFVEANPGIIVVTPTHRGGALGSIDLSQLKDYDKYVDANGENIYRFANNLARLDILEVLKWINENIADFGGNPDDVSIGGQSSGGNLCASVMMMPEAKELWDKALLQESFPLDGSLMPLDEAKGVAAATFEKYEVTTVEALLVKIDELCEASKTYVPTGPFDPNAPSFNSVNPAGFGYKAQCPVVDDVVISSDYYDQLLGEDGLWAGKPILFGNNEGCYDQMYSPDKTDEQNMTTARGRSLGNVGVNGWYGYAIGTPGTEGYIENYADYIITQYQANSAIYGRNGVATAQDLDYDLNMRIPSILFAEAASESTDIYFYQLRFNSKDVINHVRAGHGSENSVIMRTWVPNDRGEDKAADRAVIANRISDIWAQFIQTGDPNNANLGGAVWKPYQTGTRDTMILDNEFYMVNGVRNEDIDLIMPIMREYTKLLEITGVPATVTRGEHPDLSKVAVGPAGYPARATGEIEWTTVDDGATSGKIVLRATIKDAICDVKNGSTGTSAGVVTSDFVKDFEIAIIDFTDIPGTEYYAKAVAWAVDEDITTGTSDTTFSPDADCTRAQAVTFLWRAAGSPKATAATCAFTDIDKDEYYYDAVLWAVENGITTGASETEFAPDETVTRAQVVTFLYRFAKGTGTDSNPFNDVAADDYFADAVKWAVANDITNGTGATTFSPNDGCARAQIVTFLYRLFA